VNAALHLVPPIATAAAAPVSLDESVLTAAVATAAREGKTPLDVLAEMTGLNGAGVAAAVAYAFRYPYLSAAELTRLEPAFDLLPGSEAARRGCVLARDGERLIAVISDPFDAALRPWIEARAPEMLEWAIAARPEIVAFIGAREQSVRAIDAAVEHAQIAVDASHAVENLSLASINEDASPIVKLVHSTVFDALRAGASDIHLETAKRPATAW